MGIIHYLQLQTFLNCQAIRWNTWGQTTVPFPFESCARHPWEIPLGQYWPVPMQQTNATSRIGAEHSHLQFTRKKQNNHHTPGSLTAKAHAKIRWFRNDPVPFWGSVTFQGRFVSFGEGTHQYSIAWRSPLCTNPLVWGGWEVIFGSNSINT